MQTVLVVGAGPAGISACMTLKKNDVQVALIDRHMLPGGKACAGGLTKEAWGPAGIDPKNPPPFAQTFGEILIESDLGKTTLRNDSQPLITTVDRQIWQMDNIRLLKKQGVEVSLGERLLSIGNGAAVTDKGERKFDWLVGADGASSRTRRLLGLKQKSTMRARQIRLSASLVSQAGIETSLPIIWFDSSIACPGYAWSFPFGKEVRLGLGASAKSLEKDELKKIFNGWLASLGLNTSMGKVESGTIGCGYLGHRFGRVFLAGDAAGLASPLTGEGMGQACISGREVALEIIDSKYRSKKIAELARRHRRTQEILAGSFFGGPSFLLAPYLLRVPFIRKEALKRYV